MKDNKQIQSFGEFNENLNDVRSSEIKCKWCDKKFKPTKRGQFCCSPEHDSKYNDYLTKSNSENPWDKYTKDGYTKTQMDELVSQYFDEIFKVKSTPSGVFKRARKMTDWFNNLLLTLTDKETYGRYYITWDTYWSKDGMVERGKQIPIGFHGTEDAERIETTIQNKIDGLGKNQKFKKSNLNFSFGCVNFQDQDLIKIEKFIDYGDLSFWLPDKNTNILTIDEESWKNS